MEQAILEKVKKPKNYDVNLAVLENFLLAVKMLKDDLDLGEGSSKLISDIKKASRKFERNVKNVRAIHRKKKKKKINKKTEGTVKKGQRLI